MFVDKKLASISKFSLIILRVMSECWEALFLSNLSMSFFMPLILTSEKRNVSFSQLLCVASMLGWSLYLKIALNVGSAMFSVTESRNIQILYYIWKLFQLYLWFFTIFRFFTIFFTIFRVSAVSDLVFKVSPFPNSISYAWFVWKLRFHWFSK